VSRSLSNDPQISERTRAHVRQIAEQLGYVPNAAAQNLALRRSQTIGLMVPDVTDPVHGQMVRASRTKPPDTGPAMHAAGVVVTRRTTSDSGRPRVE